MGIRDHLRVKGIGNESAAAATPQPMAQPEPPEFTIMRSDTYTQEVLVSSATARQPSARSMPTSQSSESIGSHSKSSLLSRLKPRSRADSDASSKDPPSPISPGLSSPGEGKGKRLSQRLGLGKRELSSERVPQDLPDIDSGMDASNVESRWEERATILARSNEHSRNPSPSPSPRGDKRNQRDVETGLQALDLGTHDGDQRGKHEDDTIQEAVRLHEAGDLTKATEMFGRLADPKGTNNALSQVLYGLALRHGWGVAPDTSRALHYLNIALANSASIEEVALKSGRREGGAAKGELVLALFELANCYQQGWGVKKDLVAAKTYYETAANLGDTDAMNEVARFYLEGIGCKKDKQASAKYYRLAEKGGNKTIGNTWIWKEKYDPPK